MDMECNGGDLRQPYHHNLLANNSSRSCRFNGARNTDLIVFIEYINNVNFNWGRSNSVYGGENTGNKKYSVHECNMLNNYYKPGPALGTGNNISFVLLTPERMLFLEDLQSGI